MLFSMYLMFTATKLSSKKMKISNKKLTVRCRLRRFQAMKEDLQALTGKNNLNKTNKIKFDFKLIVILKCDLWHILLQRLNFVF